MSATRHRVALVVLMESDHEFKLEATHRARYALVDLLMKHDLIFPTNDGDVHIPVLAVENLEAVTTSQFLRVVITEDPVSHPIRARRAGGDNNA